MAIGDVYEGAKSPTLITSYRQLCSQQKERRRKGSEREIEIRRRSNKNYELRRRRKMEIFELLPFPPHSLSSLTLMTIKMEESPLPSADNTIPLFLSSPQFLWRPDASANFNCCSVRSSLRSFAVWFYELCFCHSGVKKEGRGDRAAGWFGG